MMSTIVFAYLPSIFCISLDDILDTDTVESSVKSVVQKEPENTNFVNMNKPYYKEQQPVLGDNNSYETKLRKLELLRIFNELKIQGYTFSTNYNMNSSISEMELEFEVLKSMKTKRNALKLSQGFLINAVQALEFLNTQYDPLGMDLVGFSEIVSLGVDDYNDVLEELYEKYKTYGRKVEPEIKLVLMISASATSFHASKQLLNKIPGMQDQLKKNPSFINKLGKELVRDKINDNQEEEFNLMEKNNMNSRRNFDIKRRNRNKKQEESNNNTNNMTLNI